ncbi:hypothetical protein CAMSH0001_1009, partial [Campylobacter showae RM3277]
QPKPIRLKLKFTKQIDKREQKRQRKFELNLSEFNSNSIWQDANLASNLTAPSRI